MRRFGMLVELDVFLVKLMKMNVGKSGHDSIFRIMVYLFLITIVFGCEKGSGDKVYYDQVIEIKGDNQYPDINNGSFISLAYEFDQTKKKISNKVFDRDIHYLPLETSNEALVASIDQLIISDDRVMILDKKTKSIFVFDLNGKFKLKINSIGNGPMEYRVPKRIEWNQYLNTIEVLDNARGLIQRYDILTGNHVGTLKVGFGIHSFKLFKKGHYAFLIDSYLFNEDRYAQVKSLNKQFLIAREKEEGGLEYISEHLPYQKNSGVLNHTLSQALRSGVNSDLLSNVVFNDTIYSFSEKGISPKYVFDFTKWTVPFSFASRDLDDTRRLFDEGALPIINWFWETKDYVFANVFLNKQVSYGFFSLISDEKIFIQSSDYLQAGRAFFNPPVAANDTSLIYTMEPSEVYEIMSIIDRRIDGLYPNANAKRKREVIDSFYVKKEGYEYLDLLDQGLKEDDNPVLVFAKPNFTNHEN